LRDDLIFKNKFFCSFSLVAWITVFSLLLTMPLAIALNADKLQSAYLQRFGAAALPNFAAWQKMLESIKDLRAEEKIKRVNEFFNRRITWADDQKIWGQADYWATPLETLGRATGDCEDFAIAKYYTLISAGIPVSKLRLVYVKAKNGNVPGLTTTEQAHMVMAYYPNPDAEPMILDNLITDIRPASRRPDLQPIFSFNSEGVYVGPSAKDEKSGNARLSRWQDLLQRAQDEGFDQ
jgi:predicted transglutaminase-like cysteine proteinase